MTNEKRDEQRDDELKRLNDVDVYTLTEAEFEEHERAQVALERLARSPLRDYATSEFETL